MRPGPFPGGVVAALAGLLAVAPLAAAPPPAPAAPPAPAEAPAKQPLAALPYTPSLEPAFLDRSVDPCVDFYAYSCGGWRKANPIPPDEANWSVYGKLEQENEQYLWGILEDAARPDPARDADRRKIGDFFASCMDLDAVDRAGAAPLAPDLAAIDALRTKAEIPALLGRLHLGPVGRGMLFGFGVEQDPGDANQEIAVAGAGGLGLPDRDYYLKTDAKSVELRAAYRDFVRKIFALLGDAPERAGAEADLVLRLETSLAGASLTRVELRDPYKTYHRMPLAELQKSTPSFAWSEYLRATGAPAIETLNVAQPAFYREVEARISGESLADWKTYLRWHLARSAAPYLSKPFRDAHFDFYWATLRGVREPEPRWQRCVEWTDEFLGEALGKVFVARTFSPETKQAAVAMTGYIEKAMGDRIRALDWMSAATKERALAKLAAMRAKIGYPDRWRDYSAYEVRRGDFFGDVLRGSAFEDRRQFAKIGRPVDRGEWEMTPPTVNAYYDSSMNDLNFPAGVLQPPLYDPKLDDAPNYGNTGSTIGHELTHGFDDEGRKFDGAGNLADWWTPEDAKAFEARTQCIVDQYAQYPVVDEVKINSQLTLGEDLADLGGTILAWQAWKAATADQRLEPRDGLTPDQRFFVGLAQWACENDRPENLRLHAATNPHSPGVWRINGVVANMPEFAAAFQCKAGQPMVREKVCRVW